MLLCGSSNHVLNRFSRVWVFYHLARHRMHRPEMSASLVIHFNFSMQMIPCEVSSFRAAQAIRSNFPSERLEGTPHCTLSLRDNRFACSAGPGRKTRVALPKHHDAAGNDARLECDVASFLKFHRYGDSGIDRRTISSTVGITEGFQWSRVGSNTLYETMVIPQTARPAPAC